MVEYAILAATTGVSLRRQEVRHRSSVEAGDRVDWRVVPHNIGEYRVSWFRMAVSLKTHVSITVATAKSLLLQSVRTKNPYKFVFNSLNYLNANLHIFYAHWLHSCKARFLYTAVYYLSTPLQLFHILVPCLILEVRLNLVIIHFTFACNNIMHP